MRLQEISISDDACGRMLAWRHAIHANPETAFQEHHTADLVADVLQNMGFVVHRGLGVTGVVATITNGSGPTIMLRAEMDALDMQELGKPSYASTRPNKMHACGHDGHTAMLLGAADYLREQKPFEGTVHFVFQPAEENEAGGRKMIEDGLFDLFPTEAVYGMHNVPQIPRGKFAIRTGIMSANLDTFEICITGKGGHAAMPETGTDAIVAACQLVNALQTIASRRTSATESVVVSVTQIHGGDTWNVIPETVLLRGTVRSFDPKTQDNTESFMNQMCEGVARTTGVAISLNYRRGYPCVVNSAPQTASAIAAAVGLVGESEVYTDIKPSMGSEDFAFMLQKRPGAYIYIGAGEGENDPLLHNPYYDFNDSILSLGAAYWIALVKQQLHAGSTKELKSASPKEARS